MLFPETTIKHEETSEIKRNKSLLASFLKDVESMEVHVGWFGGRYREGRNNPTIAYVNEVGSYVASGGKYASTRSCLSTDHDKLIPPRPFIRPAIQEDGEKIANKFAKNVKQSMKDLDPEILSKAFVKVGKEIKESIQYQMETGDFTPISEYTQQMRFEAGRSHLEPLIDTGELYNSIEYKITTTQGGSDEPF